MMDVEMLTLHGVRIASKKKKMQRCVVNQMVATDMRHDILLGQYVLPVVPK